MSEEKLQPMDKLEVLASMSFPSNSVLVDVVDFLNKSLKQEGYIFGITKKQEKMTIVIYDSK